MTDRRDVLLVDAFTAEPMTGNPAGVVPDASGLEADQMQRIAAELGASETAFVLPSETAAHRLRYFTPTTEVDLCGHATVGAVAALADRGALGDGSHAVETAAGTIEVERDDDGTVWMTQSPPTIEATDVTVADAAAALDLDTAALSEVGEDLPIARASTGLPFLVVPVGYFEQLSAIDADDEAVADLCEATGTEGLYAFTFDTLAGDATAHGRAFVPLAGIPEDPVTGTASGAVAAYLRHYDAVDAPDPLVFEQGHFLDRPGRVRVRTDGDAPQVGGRTVTTLEGSLVVPDHEDDDLIEA
jgi:PhzF family phenazine biosynthesis protein